MTGRCIIGNHRLQGMVYVVNGNARQQPDDSQTYTGKINEGHDDLLRIVKLRIVNLRLAKQVAATM
jgi:hypothetical protein